MRIVSEWKDYDNEVKQLWDNVYRGKTETADEDEAGRTQKGAASLDFEWLGMGKRVVSNLFIYFLCTLLFVNIVSDKCLCDLNVTSLHVEEVLMEKRCGNIIFFNPR